MRQENKETVKIVLLAIIVIALLVLFFIFQDSKKNETQVSENIPNAVDYSPELKDIGAESYYVYDINEQKVLFAKNEHEKLPLASITKLMSGFVALDILPSSTIITISKDDTALGSGTGLVVGEKWKLKELLDFSLITSSNDGIHAISSALNSYLSSTSVDIIKIMNEKAYEFGLLNTTFINSTGLDVDETVSGAYSSSYDVAILLQKILSLNPELIAETKNTSEKFISESNMVHFAKNTNISINNIPSIIASKTGFTDLAGGNLAIVFDAGFSHPVIVVVLGSTEEGRFTDVERLVNVSLEKLSE